MSDQTPELASYKRIILCADGTWLASDQGSNSAPTNVAKLARAIANNGLDDRGRLVKQIVSYHSGLGSADLPLQKAIYGSLGWGIDTDVCQIYDFISNNHEPGDELFFFGFSRGAFTVRSVAGLVCEIGVLSAVQMSCFAEMWDAYRANTDGRPFRESEWYLKNEKVLGLTDVKVKVVGVWDTVGALGIPEWPLVGWLRHIGLPMNRRYAFHNTNVSKNLEYAFQALALDEKRLTFPPTLWHKRDGGPTKGLEQCWFPGVHGDIGMGYNTFAWMLDNVRDILTFEDAAINDLVIYNYDSWDFGPIVDNFSGLQGSFFRLLGEEVRTPGNYPQDPGNHIDGETNESFHPIVRIRRIRFDYQPASLQGYSPQRLNGGTGWEWVKDGVGAVLEFLMDTNKKLSVAYEQNNSVTYGTREGFSRTLTADLEELDGDNEHSGGQDQG